MNNRLFPSESIPPNPRGDDAGKDSPMPENLPDEQIRLTEDLQDITVHQFTSSIPDSPGQTMANDAALQELPAPGSAQSSNAVGVACRMPALDRWRDIGQRPDGSMVELVHIWALKGEWSQMPESGERRWRTHDFGLFVLAYREAN